MITTRRHLIAVCLGWAAVTGATGATASEDGVWTAAQAYQAVLDGRALILDIRSRQEWMETGIADGAWPISMHEDGFAQRVFQALELSDGRTIALICATGGRSNYILGALRQAGYDGFVDVAEGMFGSAHGAGWIANGLPVVPLDTALANMPPDLIQDAR